MYSAQITHSLILHCTTSAVYIKLASCQGEINGSQDHCLYSWWEKVALKRLNCAEQKEMDFKDYTERNNFVTLNSVFIIPFTHRIVLHSQDVLISKAVKI